MLTLRPAVDLDEHRERHRLYFTHFDGVKAGQMAREVFGLHDNPGRPLSSNDTTRNRLGIAFNVKMGGVTELNQTRCPHLEERLPLPN